MCDFSQFLLIFDKADGSNGTPTLALLWLRHPLETRFFWTCCIVSAAGAAGSPCPTPASPVSGDSLD